LDAEQQRRLLLDALAAQARRNQVTALLIDDAQNLSTEVLLHLQEFVATPAIPSQRLQVVLAALPEITGKLDQPELRRFWDSIRVHCHLERLSPLETGLFVEQQLQLAGHKVGCLFSPAALERIGAYCKGVPRAIAILCDTVLLFASLHAEQEITPKLVDEAAQNCFFGEQSRLATKIGSDLPDDVPTTETLTTAPAERADFNLDLSEFNFSFDSDQPAMSAKQPAMASPVGATALILASPPPVSRYQPELVESPSKRDQQPVLNRLQPAPLDSWPQADPRLDAKGVEPRLAESRSRDGIYSIQATDSLVCEGNQPVAPGNLQSIVGNNSWLARLLSSSIEQENPMSRLDKLNKILKTLQNESPGVEASALISEDGLMIASALPQDLDETRVAGMTATLLNLGTRAATELHRGDVQEVIVRGEHGYSVMISAGRGALLLVLTNENSKLGLIFFQ
jgi:predicted regulator of Ras-like GTPase activity (Roadblock/LC7/MglB family)